MKTKMGTVKLISARECHILELMESWYLVVNSAFLCTICPISPPGCTCVDDSIGAGNRSVERGRCLRNTSISR